jgi:alpha-L-fucosidase
MSCKGNLIENGNDGSASTRWCAADGQLDHWWQVDLGASYNLTGSEVMWEFGGRVYDYRVEVSTDGSTWTTAVDKTDNASAAQTQNDPFTASARYVRITVTGLPASTWASFYEFRVFLDFIHFKSVGQNTIQEVAASGSVT